MRNAPRLSLLSRLESLVAEARELESRQATVDCSASSTQSTDTKGPADRLYGAQGKRNDGFDSAMAFKTDHDLTKPTNPLRFIGRLTLPITKLYSTHGTGPIHFSSDHQLPFSIKPNSALHDDDKYGRCNHASADYIAVLSKVGQVKLRSRADCIYLSSDSTIKPIGTARDGSAEWFFAVNKYIDAFHRF